MFIWQKLQECLYAALFIFLKQQQQLETTQMFFSNKRNSLLDTCGQPLRISSDDRHLKITDSMILFIIIL